MTDNNKLICLGSRRFWGRCLNMLTEGLSMPPAELSSPCGLTIWVSVSLLWLRDHHALQLHSGFCCEPLRSSHALCKSPIASHLKSLGLSLDFWTWKDLIDKDRIYKLKGVLTKVEMIKDRVDDKTHLSLLSLSHISGIFIFNFRNDGLLRILGFGQNVI